MKPVLLLFSFVFGAAAAEHVDFSYAFATPHRMTIARPSASEKTLLDAETGSVTALWTYEDLRSLPLSIFKAPRLAWRVRIRPLVDDKPFAESTWTRGDGFLPMLDNRYGGSIRLEAIGGRTGALIRISVHNPEARPHRYAIDAEVLRGWVAHNPAWMEPGVNPDSLVACQGERPDRILMLGVGAERFPRGRMNMRLEWDVPPGESRTGWIVRPYEAYEAELPALRSRDWADEFTAAKAEWHELLGRAARFEIPDREVRNAFYAGIADLFIMREPLANGYVGGIAGTEVYRSNNPGEPCIAAIALDQLGLHRESADGLRVHLDQQEPNGEWADRKGWAHHFWGASGFKAWPVLEHYRLAGDRAFLEAAYPRLAASSRWQESQRARTRVLTDGQRPATYGLMPRGMGDGGLMSGTDYFGVFYTHNILTVFADQLSVEPAEILGKKADLAELRRIHETALADLKAAMEKGAITESGYRWIPGSPTDPSGSRWGALYALFPAQILPADHPLIEGTIRKMQQTLSPGGQPLNTGWMPDGAWVAITLDNLAEAHLVRDEADRAVDYLYSTLNHGTPLYSWCEERAPEPGAKKTTGDRQHLWTPLAVVRYLRDSLVMEQEGRLHLARATARTWLAQGKEVSVTAAPTHFGRVSYAIRSDVERGALHANVTLPPGREIILHLRHPQRASMRSVTVNGKAWTDFDPKREIVRLRSDSGRLEIVAKY